MMTNYELLPATARVWIYQSDQAFEKTLLPEIKLKIQNFINSWLSHNRQLRAYGGLYHQRFIVLMVDEDQADASGCSIDASVHFIQRLGAEYNRDLFNRMLFAYKDGEDICIARREEFAQLYKAGKINDTTLVFDNLVKNKGDFDTKWIKPLGESWHQRIL